MTVKTMSEDQMVQVVRNALLVAGHEMGAEGDHWPVINATVHEIMKDWEDVKIERNVFAEVKKNYETMIQELITVRNGSSASEQGELDSIIVELRAMYRAAFEEVQNDYLEEDAFPDHINRAKVIIDTLEDEDE